MDIKIIRGSHQIGGNIIEISTKNHKIILDCGKNLPPLDGSKNKDELKVDGLTHGTSTYDGVFITHYHGDHCGLLETINKDIPVYASCETAATLNTIADFTGQNPPRISRILEPGDVIEVGDIEVITMPARHSAAGAFMFLIRAEGKQVLYTGDFLKVDRTYLATIGNIDALICEGTNLGGKTGKSEEEIGTQLARLMADNSKNIFILSSSANNERIRSVESACRKSGRIIAMDLFMSVIYENLPTLKYSNLIGYNSYFVDKDKLPRQHKYLLNYINGGSRQFVSTEVLASMEGLTIFVRPTMQKFMERFNSYSPLKGSVLVYSMWSGYKKTPKVSEYLDYCKSMDMEVIELHASGHAYRDQIEYFLSLKPKVVIPIHTEHPEEYREIFDNVEVIIDGQKYAV
jgi:ribonuclease J